MYLIPIYFIIYRVNIRQSFIYIGYILYRGLNVLFAMLFNIILFAGLGKLIFFTFISEDNIFIDFFEASFQLFIL